MKIGVAITDVLTGLYAAVSILAGLYQRDATGPSSRGTHAAAPRQNAAPPAFDLALADCTLAAMVNIVEGVLVTGERPQRLGNAHPQIVPYEAFATADGYLVLAVGNDRQWERFCEVAKHPEWAADPRFATNPARVEHRAVLIPLLEELLAAHRQTPGGRCFPRPTSRMRRCWRSMKSWPRRKSPPGGWCRRSRPPTAARTASWPARSIAMENRCALRRTAGAGRAIRRGAPRMARL